MSELLTPAGIAKIYDVCSKTVLRWLAEGRITAEVQEKQVIRFDPDQVALELKANAKKKAKQKKSLV